MTVFLPCRAGSERVPQKNTKDFAGIKGGLLTLKIKTLLGVPKIDNIVVSTNDNEVIRLVKHFDSKHLRVDIRPEFLASSQTSTDLLAEYIPSIISDNNILWTHVTSPFISIETYNKAINQFLNNKEFDSLMSVNKMQTFLWDENGPINYNREIEKWPRTQTLPKVYELNSGFFINTRENYLKFKDRIGEKPFLFETNGIESFDIDWEDDFNFAELIYKSINN